MEKHEILQRVKEIVAEKLGVDIESVQLKSDIQEDLRADSLDIVDLIQGLEDEFGIEIMGDAGTLKTIEEVADYIESKINT